MATPVALDRVTALALAPGGEVVVVGVVRTSRDGSSFDAVMQADGLSPGALRAGGLFDLAAGGLRVVAQRPDLHEYTLTPTGSPGSACVAAGVGTPCLVPRLGELAHERLMTATELATTMTGTMEVAGIVVPPLPLVSPETGRGLGLAALVALAGALAWLALSVLRRRARTALGRVRSAAREALRATRRDPSLGRVRQEVRAMMARAQHLEASRRACTARLSRIDRASLERRREAAARSSSPDAADALSWLTAECAEAERLRSDLASCVLGLARIESALRVVALRARPGRGTRARVAVVDPVDAAAMELALRDDALLEAERAAHS